MVKVGKYQAKVADYTVATTKAGAPVVKVWLDVEGQGQVQWSGYFTEKTQQRTLESLTFMGFKGESLDVLADGPISGALDRNTPVNITVVHEADMKDASKKYAKVQWINRAGTNARQADPVQTAEAKVKLAAFTGALKKVQAELGVKPSAEAQNTTKLAL